MSSGPGAGAGAGAGAASATSSGAGAALTRIADFRERQRLRVAGAPIGASNVRIVAHWEGRSCVVPVRDDDTVKNIEDRLAVKAFALRPPRLFSHFNPDAGGARKSFLSELSSNDMAVDVLRDGETVLAVWDRPWHALLGAEPALMAVADFLGDWRDLARVQACCRKARRAVRALKIDWQVTMWEYDELFARRTFKLMCDSVSRRCVKSLAAWRVSFPHAASVGAKNGAGIIVDDSDDSDADNDAAGAMAVVVGGAVPTGDLRGVRRFALYSAPHAFALGNLRGLGGIVDLNVEGAFDHGGPMDPHCTIAALTSLRRLGIHQRPGRRVSTVLYEALEHSHLEALDVSDVYIRNQDVLTLPATLQRLRVGSWKDSMSFGNAFSDTGCQFLTRLTALAELRVRGRTIGDPGVAALATLPSLTRLEVFGRRITDTGVGSIAGIVGLRDLALNVPSSHVTDAGIGYLARLTNLRRLLLEVVDTSVSVASLAPLAPRCLQLEHIAVVGEVPFRGTPAAPRAVDLAPFGALKRLTLTLNAPLSAREETELRKRGVFVDPPRIESPDY